MKTAFFKIAMGYVRHALTGFGGALVTKGVMNGQQELAIIGGIMAALGVAWSHFSKLPAPVE